MRKTETVELTVLCLIEDGNKILLQNRVKKDWQGYALPGGHVESGESFVDAAIREMKEETGLTVIEPRLAGVKQFPICRRKEWISVVGATCLVKTNSFRCTKVDHGLFSFQMNRIISDDVYWF